MNDTETYQAAVRAIRAVAEQRQAALDQAVTDTQTAWLTEARLAAERGCTPGAQAAIGALVAQTVTLVLRASDGWPSLSIPDTTVAAVRAAGAAGVLLAMHDKFWAVGSVCVGNHPYQGGLRDDEGDLRSGAVVARQTWREADTYRQAQRWATL